MRYLLDTKEHLLTFAQLDTVEGHNEPSDRLIITQALTEKMPVKRVASSTPLERPPLLV